MRYRPRTASLRKNAEATLYLVQHADIEPLMFPIDYGWGYAYLPKESFDPPKN